ncbi:MAG: hypothetical protein AAF503_05765 [Pseudomonadota bacterium]
MSDEEKDTVKPDTKPDVISDDQLDDVDGGLFLNKVSVTGINEDTINGFMSAPDTINAGIGQDFLRKRPGRTKI